MKNASKSIGSRWECLCCGRTARITDQYDGGYEYIFEKELGSRWIGEQDAKIRFRPIGDDMETVKAKLEESNGKENRTNA